MLKPRFLAPLNIERMQQEALRRTDHLRGAVASGAGIRALGSCTDQHSLAPAVEVAMYLYPEKVQAEIARRKKQVRNSPAVIKARAGERPTKKKIAAIEKKRRELYAQYGIPESALCPRV